MTAVGSAPPRLQVLITGLAMGATAVTGLGAAAPAGAGHPQPEGYRVVAAAVLPGGVEHLALESDDPRRRVHVARLERAAARRLVPVLAGDRLARSDADLETTSSICARHDCVVAVNGDFWDPGGLPVGAMVAAGELITTPSIDHIAFSIGPGGRVEIGHGFDWRVAVSALDGHALALDAVNRPGVDDGVVLYSSRWGPTTRSGPDALEVPLELFLPASPVLPAGATAVRVGPVHDGGDAPIAPGSVVLSGRGRGAAEVAALAAHSQLPLLGGAATLHVDAGGVAAAIGGSPQLLAGGEVAFPVGNLDSFTRRRHARTMVGVSGSGEVLLVTVDAGAGWEGLTLAEAAGLMADLGAVDAVNLDGGGSTTFAVGGEVRNQPPLGERPVASALVLASG